MAARLASKDMLRYFAAHLRARGADPLRLARRAGILGETDSHAPAFLPAEAIQRFCELGAVEIGDPHLGLHAAELTDRGAAGVVEFGARFAPTFGEAVRFVVRHHALLRGVSRLHMEETGRGPRLELVPPEDPGASWPVEEFELVALLRILREAGGADWVPRAMGFGHPPPEGVTELARTLGIPRIDFGEKTSFVQLAASAMDRKNPHADPPLFAFLASQAGQALETLGIELVPGFIRERLVSLLSSTVPDLPLLAKSLHMSTRTLQRRLELSGTTYQDLLDSVRCELATRLLDQTGISVSALATRLGYSTPRAFLRAFQRWTRTTPAQWRRRGDVLTGAKATRWPRG